MIHELKILPNYFEEVIAEAKTYEVRFNDRNFQEGDTVILKEWFRTSQRYSGRKLEFKIGFVLSDFEGLKEGWVVFSLLRSE